jgi:hypothetical protein
MTSRDRRVRTLLRWYPKSWRDAHDEEFTALLEDSIADRPFWPRRDIDIVIQGSLLRLSRLGERLTIQPGRSISGRSTFVVFSAIIFIGYSLLFATVGLTKEFAHGFESAVAPLSLVVSVLVSLVGLALLCLGVVSVVRDRSLRRGWPVISLGGSLIMSMTIDRWHSGLTRFSGWLWFRDLAPSLDPFAWVMAFRSPPYAIPAKFAAQTALARHHEQAFFFMNSISVAIVAVSAIAIIRRVAAAPDHWQLTNVSRRILTGLMLAVVSSSWVWAAETTGALSWDVRFVIPFVMTMSAAPVVRALSRSMTSCTPPDSPLISQDA